MKRLVFMALVSGLLAVGARAAMYDPTWEWTFNDNNSGVAGTVASYLSVDVVAGPTEGTVDFIFSNFSDQASAVDAAVIGTPVITEIYFEDGTLLNLATIFDVDFDATYTGLDFEPPPTPAKLPGFNKFWTTAQFSVDADNGNETPDGNANGIGPGESLTLRYTLQNNLGFADVISAIGLGFDATEYYESTPLPRITQVEGDLRIGIHVRGVGEGSNFSEGFLLTPVPGAVLLGMLGLSVAGLMLRKRA
jgi:hypothetical protein